MKNKKSRQFYFGNNADGNGIFPSLRFYRYQKILLRFSGSKVLEVFRWQHQCSGRLRGSLQRVMFCRFLRNLTDGWGRSWQCWIHRIITVLMRCCWGPTNRGRDQGGQITAFFRKKWKMENKKSRQFYFGNTVDGNGIFPSLRFYWYQNILWRLSGSKVLEVLP